MPGDVAHRILRRNGYAKLLQGLVLRSFKAQAFQAFEFDADGVVVAALAPAPLAHAGMPGTVVAADELPDFALTRDKEM
ncbi:hypothetical protein SDC9_112530 [bioreactor metagenome]|uniref:Uncharacterized protein n=1 Tax=bioreactor metagenome TaxID=1076179 RepID=A0A645BQX4_9ZZZZ